MHFNNSKFECSKNRSVRKLNIQYRGRFFQKLSYMGVDESLQEFTKMHADVFPVLYI